MKLGSFIAGMAVGIATSAIVATASVSAASKSGCRDAQEEKNKEIAIEFYDRALNQKDWNKARELIGNRYTQHNPAAVDGFEGIKNHIEMLKEKFPQNHGELKHALADGDLVALHMHSKRTPDSRGNAIVDMFRIENGKVVEHWDVVQAIPEKSKNDNTMF